VEAQLSIFSEKYDEDGRGTETLLSHFGVTSSHNRRNTPKRKDAGNKRLEQRTWRAGGFRGRWETSGSIKKAKSKTLRRKSGRHDLNVRPLRPERSALARLSYAPIHSTPRGIEIGVILTILRLSSRGGLPQTADPPSADGKTLDRAKDVRSNLLDELHAFAFATRAQKLNPVISYLGIQEPDRQSP
jgi:hypothetical protein